jgi:hypothetical protein
MGINECNPYTNWYRVYPIATLYEVLYENNIVDRCSSQSVLFSLTNLVNNVPSTLLINLACPFPLGIHEYIYNIHWYNRAIISF